MAALQEAGAEVAASAAEAAKDADIVISMLPAPVDCSRALRLVR